MVMDKEVSSSYPNAVSSSYPNAVSENGSGTLYARYTNGTTDLFVGIPEFLEWKSHNSKMEI